VRSRNGAMFDPTSLSFRIPNQNRNRGRMPMSRSRLFNRGVSPLLASIAQRRRANRKARTASVRASLTRSRSTTNRARNQFALPPRRNAGQRVGMVNSRIPLTGVIVPAGAQFSSQSVPFSVRVHDLMKPLQQPLIVTSDCFTTNSTNGGYGSVPITPIMLKRLAAHSNLYQNARLERLTFTFKPVNGTSISGLIAMAIDYNAASSSADDWTNITAFTQSDSFTFSPWQAATLSYRRQDQGDNEYGDSLSDTSFRPDSKGYVFHWIMDSLPSASIGTNYGYLEIDIVVSYRNARPTSVVIGGAPASDHLESGAQP
jgi:hypothetical protein